MTEEQVLVVTDDQVMEIPEGFNPVDPSDLTMMFWRATGFMRRSAAEDNPDYRQIIPYCLVQYKSEHYLYQRIGRESEKRLLGKFSIGVGGHINKTDDGPSLMGVIKSAARRELFEELIFSSYDRIDLIGTIKLSDTPVDRVHLGLVFTVKSESPKVYPGETDKMVSLGFKSAATIKKQYDGKLENWSQLIIDALVA